MRLTTAHSSFLFFFWKKAVENYLKKQCWHFTADVLLMCVTTWNSCKRIVHGLFVSHRHVTLSLKRIQHYMQRIAVCTFEAFFAFYLIHSHHFVAISILFLFICLSSRWMVAKVLLLLVRLCSVFRIAVGVYIKHWIFVFWFGFVSTENACVELVCVRCTSTLFTYLFFQIVSFDEKRKNSPTTVYWSHSTLACLFRNRIHFKFEI